MDQGSWFFEVDEPDAFDIDKNNNNKRKEKKFKIVGNKWLTLAEAFGKLTSHPQSAHRFFYRYIIFYFFFHFALRKS